MKLYGIRSGENVRIYTTDEIFLRRSRVDKHFWIIDCNHDKGGLLLTVCLPSFEWALGSPLEQHEIVCFEVKEVPFDG